VSSYQSLIFTNTFVQERLGLKSNLRQVNRTVSFKYIQLKEVIALSRKETKNVNAVDSVRRKLLKIGIYSVPTIILLGRASVARASGSTSPPSPQ